MVMPSYSKSKYFCGIDLHKDNMFVCLIDNTGKIIFHKRIPARYSELKAVIGYYLKDCVIGIESTYNYYWLQDACQADNVTFLLGHALYMGIGNFKQKDDDKDSFRIAEMLKNGNFPIAYAFPPELRELRDLLRERLKYVRSRASLYCRFKGKVDQYFGYLEKFDGSLIRSYAKREEFINSLKSPSLKLIFSHLHHYIFFFDQGIESLEKDIWKKMVTDYPLSMKILNSIPGIGDILSMSILLEIGKLDRFDSVQNFSSYCRVVNPARNSNNKRVDNKNCKSGNVYLKWAFSQGACLLIRNSPQIKIMFNKKVSAKGKRVALATMKHKLAVAVYNMLNKKTMFDINLFVKSMS